MRVLIDYRPALVERTGAGEYVHELVKALLAVDRSGPGSLDITLFSSSWKDRFVPSRELNGVRTIDRRVPVRLLNFAWHRLGWPAVETLAGGTYDVSHSPHPLLLPSRGAAQVVTIHDLNFLVHPEWSRAEVRRDYPALVRDHAHRADQVIVPSRFTAGEVERRLEIPPARISLCSPGAPDWPARAGPVSGGYILFIGTLEARKNVGALLAAYESLLSAGHEVPPLVLAGRATAAAAPWLEQIARAPLNGRVRHIGYVEPSKRRALYEGARLLVQPSFDEGFGLPVLEAMTIGVPVVASARGSLPEVLGDAGLTVEPEPVAIASAIRRLLDDDALAAACAAKGVLRSRDFQWDRTARQMQEAYELAVQHRGNRSL